MSIRAKFSLREKRKKKVNSTRLKPPVFTEVRTQTMSSLYSNKDFLIDLLRYYMIKQGVYQPHVPTLIVEYVPIYSWLTPEQTVNVSGCERKEGDEKMKVELSHSDTIVCNPYQEFGAVLGSKLDPRLDHVINVQLVDGVEFGFGICDESHLTKITKRDFMCIKGGYGYYNYKSHSSLIRPKYPPGLYYHVETCRKIRNESDILLAGDVLTLVIQREYMKTPGGGTNLPSRFGSARDRKFNPMDNLKASSRYTLSFYKNGEDMGFHLGNLKGPFSICLNYYFVESKIRLLSDYNFIRIYKKRNCKGKKQMHQMTNKTVEGPSKSSRRRNTSTPYGSSVTFKSITTSNVI